MIRRRRKMKLNNSGMSLMEVVISITILAVVAIPVLHSLTTAMVYNSKARIRQEMTLKAESIMESFKGYSLKELNEMFTSGTGIAGLPGAKYTPAGDPAKPEEFLKTAPAAGESFTFGIWNLTDAKNNQYTVEIKATSNGIENVLEMKDMDGTKDAIFNAGVERTFDTTASNEAWKDFKDNHVTEAVTFFNSMTDDAGNPITVVNAAGDPMDETHLTSPEVEGYLELYDRRLTFDVKDGGSGNYVVTAKMVYRYYLKDVSCYKKVIPESPSDAYPGEAESASSVPPSTSTEIGFAGEQMYKDFPESSDDYFEYIVEMKSGEEEITIYDRPVSDGLYRLFIYYYPQYELGENKKDIIEINNSAAIDGLECYIIKQRARDINDTKTELYEDSYGGVVAAGVNAGMTNIYHNFDINIAGGSSHVAPNISGSYKKADSFSESDDFKEEEAISYKLELTIKNAAGNVVTSLNSSKLEKIKD